MTAPADEKRELELVDKVEFRILAVANNEEKLKNLLKIYLAPLLLKATSDHSSVRAKVIQVCGRLKTFIQPPAVVLPVAALLDQYKKTDSTILKTLDMSFIQHSIGRIEAHERRELVPRVMQGIAGTASSHTAPSYFNLLLQLLPDLDVPNRGSPDAEGFRERVGLADPEDAKFVAQWLGKVILLRMQSQRGASERTLAALNVALTPRELEFLRPEHAESKKVYANMPALRRKAVALLASPAFADEERFLPALFASASSDSQVAGAGNEIIKRAEVSLEDPALVRRLFDAHGRMPADVRIRILERLCRSEAATEMSDEISRVVDLDFLAADEPGAESSSSADPRRQLQPTSYLERTKLHRALFQFLAWVGRTGAAKGDLAIGSKLVDRMRTFVEDSGWPVPAKSPLSGDDATLRGLAYETIGLVGRGSAWTAQSRLSVIGFLFRSLAEDPTPEVVVHVDAALSSLISRFSAGALDALSSQAFKGLMLDYMLRGDEPPVVRSARHAAVKCANQCLPFSDVSARWIDILAVAGRQGERSDVVEEGQKGLDPWTYYAHSDAAAELPPWTDMLAAFFASRITATGLDESWLRGGAASHPSTGQDWDLFTNFPRERILAFPVALTYCKRMMFLGGLRDFKLEPDWMQRLDTLVRTDIVMRARLRAYLRDVDPAFVVALLRACLQGMAREDERILEECLQCFVDVASLSPASALAYLGGGHEKGILQLAASNNKEIRALCARACGIVAAHPGNSDSAVLGTVAATERSVAKLAGAVGAKANLREGVILASGYIASRGVYYGRGNLFGDFKFPVEILFDDGAHPSLRDAVVDGLAQLWTAGLYVPAAEGDHSTSKTITRLAALAKKGNEKAISALGRLALALDAQDAGGDDEGNEKEGSTAAWVRGDVGTVLSELFKLHEIKQAEIHFTVGEAIAAAIACWESRSVELTLDVDTASAAFRKAERSGLTTAVLEKLFAGCKQTKPALIKASGIWLFCVVQYCSHLAEVQSRLREAQAGFMRLLNARDELVQETASRGLSLIYDKGDAALREELVRDLVSAFTGAGAKLKVDEDTELFDAGALPTGEGKSIVSYKDIVNLANEVGDQTLVYKFMSLATNAATWSTRSAFGRFGLSSLLGESKLEPKVYAKLFRYRFDPNPNVQRSMDDIWKAMVKDSGAALDDNFDYIMRDLLDGLLGREWRVREACCGAIADLVQGRPFPKYEPYYAEIWTKAIKVLDDVKGSVREAALKLCMGLANTIVRLLEESNNLTGTQAMLREAVPFLLSAQGMESGVKEVKLFCTQTVLGIAKRGGKALRPFVADMIPQLLGLLSTIEPEVVNYHYQRLGEENREKLDQMRATLVSQSPITEAIDNCLRQVDADAMASLVPHLETAIRGALALPTKIGCCSVLTTLCTRHQRDVAPYAARLLRLVQRQLLDRNDQASKSYAKAAAYVVRVAPGPAREEFCTRLTDLYFSPTEDGGGELRRQKVADAAVALSHVSPDHFSALEAQLLPLAYLGSHDTDEYARTEFAAVWGRQAGSGRTVARFVPEIAALAGRGLDTAQWALQHTAALATAAAVPAVAAASEATGGQIGLENLKIVWPVLERALALKTFAGKEKLLAALPEFAAKGRALWTTDGAVAAQLRKIAVREAKRNNEAYRPHAFACLWKFAEARDDLDMLGDIADVVVPVLDDFKEEDKMELDAKGDATTKAAESGVEAVARGYSRPLMVKDAPAVAARVLDLLKPYIAHARFAGVKRAVWYKAAADLMDAAQAPGGSSGPASVAAGYLDSLDLGAAEVGTEAQRLQRARTALAVVKAIGRKVFGPLGSEEAAKVGGVVGAALAEERAADVKAAWQELIGELKK